MRTKVNLYIHAVLILLFGFTAFFFWWTKHPELISFHEQNQMFLFSSEYFIERIAVAGGFADYLSEFFIQFYFYVSAGAVIIALTLVSLQLLTYKSLKTIAPIWSYSNHIISWAITVLMWLHLMDENTLLSFPLAIILSLIIYLTCRRGGWICQLIASLVLYWLVGTAFIIQVVFAIIDSWRNRSWQSATFSTILMAVTAVAWVYICRTLWVAQYPWDTVLAGINYHRLTLMKMEAPALQNVILIGLVCAALILPVLQKFKSTFRAIGNLDIAYSMIVFCLFGVLFIYPNIKESHHDANTHVILEQLYQLRKGDWNGIITKAEEYKQQKLEALESPLSCTAINLSLAKTGQLAARMFEFPQAGIQGLLMPRVRDNVSNVTTMDAFWHLGFINESLRYAFDSQESIPNCRKSAHFTCRMAECNILNGRYDVASKYIDLLKQTLFYEKWANQIETFLYNETKIKGFREWNQKLQNRLSNDFLYYYPEMTKMLGQLVQHNRENSLAYDYFMASLLLSGDTRSFVANLPPQAQQSQDPFPHGYKQYIEYMQAHARPADGVTGASY